MLYFFVFALLLLTALCFYVTQPVWGVNPRRIVSVEPRRLEVHVRTLSGGLTPRNESHPENLYTVAEYIRQEGRRRSVCGSP
jgi:hypothetical protein